MNVYAAIPVPKRPSKRFPGKFTHDILGKPMMWYPYMAAATCGDVDDACIVTDDPGVEDIAQGLNMHSLLTSGRDFHCGTDRVADAARRLWKDDADVVLNVQADEALLTPNILSSLIAVFADNTVDIATLCHGMSTRQALNPSVVKLVVDRNMRAMYFSRSVIPHSPIGDYCLGHIGVYGFRPGVLWAIADMVPSTLEVAEDLEQLRWLENCLPVQVVHVHSRHQWVNVDTAADMELVRAQLMQRRQEG